MSKDGRFCSETCHKKFDDIDDNLKVKCFICGAEFKKNKNNFCPSHGSYSNNNNFNIELKEIFKNVKKIKSKFGSGLYIAEK